MRVGGLEGAMHPLALYRSHGVPVGLATDDQGILRNDLSREFSRAVTAYGLAYSDLKDLARNSIVYSFLPGEPLSAYKGGAEARISESRKAMAERALVDSFAEFEREYLAELQRVHANSASSTTRLSAALIVPIVLLSL